MSDLNICFKILKDIIYKNQKSTDLINSYGHEISNMALVTKIVYGVIENKIYIDYMIGKLSDIRLKKIHENVLTILEIGIYNIHFLETKDYAVVDKLVSLTGEKNKKSKGFVNAILRNFIRDEKEISTIYETDDIKSLSIRYSFPRQLTNYIYESYGMDYTKAYLRDANKVRDIFIRANVLKLDRNKLKSLLEDEGYKIEYGSIAKNSLKVLNPLGLASTKLFKEGYFTIQQESSQMVVEVLNPKKNSKILDLCAAPGTKTSYLAEYTKNESKIIANDLSKNKNKLIEENIKRLGLSNIKITNYDASKAIDDFIGAFDYVLVDAPCSGLGVVGRKPEIRYNRNMETIYRLSKLQREILDRAISYLKKSGILVYSTCTIGPIENEDNFNYLKSKTDLSHIKIKDKDFYEFKSFEEGTDGFFISKFKKI